MKTYVLLLGFLLFACISIAQPWLSSLPQEKPLEQLTLYDYQKAFNDYWAPFDVIDGYYYQNGEKIKAVGWKQFHRWEWDLVNQVDVQTGRFPKKTAQQVYDEYLQFKPALSRSALANWTSLGTNSSEGGYAGLGRLNCIAFHPTDINTFWVGAPSGGLWVTKDNGQSWKCLTDKNAVLGISDIVIPSDFATSNTIFIATGDKDAWDNRSVGVLKSTDGGNSWKTTGLSYSLSDNAMVTRMLLDPSNNQTIIAATTTGIYKTTDGGTTWNNRLSLKNFVDLEYKPGDFNTLYGSSQSGGIYLSTNGGTTWKQIVFLSNGARTELAVSANQPTWVYAVASGTNRGLNGIYKSINSGAGYSKVFDGKISGNNLLGWSSSGSDTSGQGWYDLAIDASPSNANTIVVGGINTWRSNDGGSNWEIINHWTGDGAQAVHADKHMLKFRNNGDLFECNDGGIYFSDNNGNDFTDITNGMVTSQMYKLGVSQTVSNDIITGLQDNGTKLLSNGIWDDVLAGDGMECLIDYTDVNTQYGSIYYGDIYRTTTHWQNSKRIKPTAAGKGAWVTPFIIDPLNHNTLYAGFSEVWKTTNQGNSWIQISQLNSTEKLLSMSISSSDNKVMCVANSSKIWKTTNGGTNWIEITGNLPINFAKITNIEIKNNDPKTIWVSMGGYDSSGVYESQNGDAIWTSITAGLPPIPIYSVIQNKQDTSVIQLYAGTELGVFLKLGSDNWVSFNTGLPNVKIGELEIFYAPQKANSKLRAATYGRGLWESNLYGEDVPMTFKSVTVTQNNVASVFPGDSNVEIICFKIETEDVLNPLSVTQFSVSMDGTTDINDVVNIKMYYTGIDSLFATTNQFGSTTSVALGKINLIDTQILLAGTNYFWVTYDIKSTAIKGHFLDAKGLTVIVDGIQRIPSDTNPSGNRMVSLPYCFAGSSATNLEYISSVTIGTINQNSGRGIAGYEDYTSKITDLSISSQNSITVGITDPVYYDELLIWADWNIDGDFNDVGENVYSSTALGYDTYIANISPPSTAVTGYTRMRIRLNNTNNGSNNTPCGLSGYGEVEDYTINVTPFNNIVALKNNKTILLYPNPVLQQLNIEIKGASEKINLEIVNSIGQTVYKSGFIYKTVIDMSDFSSGVYLVTLKAGDSFWMRKFVKE